MSERNNKDILFVCLLLETAQSKPRRDRRRAANIHHPIRLSFAKSQSLTMAMGIVSDRPSVAVTGDVRTTLWAHMTSLRFVPTTALSANGHNCVLGSGNSKVSPPE